MDMTSSTDGILRYQARADRRRKLLYPTLRTLLRLLCRTEINGTDNIPTTGPTILMMNHMQFIDPVVVTMAVRQRWVISMAKAETLDTPLPRLMMHLWGNYTVQRGTVDRVALKTTLMILNSGRMVLIAPEGTRNRNGLQHPRDGMAYIAHKTSAVIVPTAVVGADDWGARLKRLRRAYAEVYFGRAFQINIGPDARLTRPMRAAIMREAMYQLALTIPERYAAKRGIYSDVHNATTHYIQTLTRSEPTPQPDQQPIG